MTNQEIPKKAWMIVQDGNTHIFTDLSPYTALCGYTLNPASQIISLSGMPRPDAVDCEACWKSYCEILGASLKTMSREDWRIAIDRMQQLLAQDDELTIENAQGIAQGLYEAESGNTKPLDTLFDNFDEDETA